MRGWRLLASVALCLGTIVAATLPVAAQSATVNATTNAKYGTILTTSSGMTLYWHANDPVNGSVCTGTCATYWPPLTVTAAPTAGTGVTGKLTTFTNPEGKMQVAYNGHALYTFLADKAAGQVNGDMKNGFGGLWHVTTVSVAAATSAPAATLPKTGTSPWSYAGGALLILGGLGLLVRRRPKVG